MVPQAAPRGAQLQAVSRVPRTTVVQAPLPSAVSRARQPHALRRAARRAVATTVVAPRAAVAAASAQAVPLAAVVAVRSVHQVAVVAAADGDN